MSDQNKDIKIPENGKDVNKFMYTFLHVANPTIFQLLHIEIDSEHKNLFQMYGCVRGELQKEGFLLKEIYFKLVNMIEKSKTKYKVVGANWIKNQSEPDLWDCFVEIEEVSQQTPGVDWTYDESPVLLKRGQKIDYHVGNPLTRNGRPCNNMVYF